MSAAAAALPAPATRSRREVTVVFAALMLAVLLAALDGTIVATALPTITAELGGLEPALVGRHRLPAGVDDLDAALRQARRPLRAQARLPGARSSSSSSGSALCGQSPGHGRAHRLPHAAGPRRRRAHRPGAGDHRRRRLAARPRPLPGRLRRGLRGEQRRRAAASAASSSTTPRGAGSSTSTCPIGIVALGGHRGRAARARATPRRRASTCSGRSCSASPPAASCWRRASAAQTYGWGSWQIIGLGVVTVVADRGCSSPSRSARARAGAADEPVLQPRLHGGRRDRLHRRLRRSSARRPTCRSSCRSSPAPRRPLGPQLLPLILGLLVTSIGSGQIIARWGRYQPVPDRGHGASWSSASGGCRRWSRRRARLERSLDMLILGLGIGLVMQVLVLAVQNDVDYRDLGVATSGATFFRSIGGCFGVAICGAIFSNRLADELARLSGLPPAVGVGPRHARAGRPAAARGAGGLRRRLRRRADDDLPRVRADRGGRLRPRVAAAREAAAAHGRGDRRRRGLRGAQARTTRCPRSSARSRRWRGATPASGSSSGCAEQAGVELTARQCWVLARVGENEPTDAFAIADAHAVDPARVAARIAELRELGYVEGPGEGVVLTAGGPRRARAARRGPSRAPGRAARRLVARARGRARRAAHAHGARRRRRPSRRRSAGRARARQPA